MSDEPKTTEPSEQDQTSLEAEFLARAADYEEPDDFDLELSELTRSRSRGSVLRPILMIIVVLLVGSMLNDWRDEISYFFTSPTPVEIGDPARFAGRMAEEPGWRPEVGHNQYVAVEGMPTRMSRGSRQEVFRLLGGEIYVQRELTEEERAQREGSKLPPRRAGPGVPIDEHRDRFDGTGRMVAFAAVPQHVAGLKQFYGERYNLRFCEDLSERQLQELREQRLQAHRASWERRFEEADEETRQRRNLRPTPETADEEQYLRNYPICVDAYLVIADKRPIDHWWYVALGLLLAAFMVFNIFKLMTWFRDWIEP